MLNKMPGEIPENAPDHCPGTASDDAGKSSACAGCPNQQICASGETKGPDPSIKLVQDRLVDVKNKILILSGKGGVGKSTVTSLLSRGLAQANPDLNFGVLDIDICGPSQPRYNKLNFLLLQKFFHHYFNILSGYLELWVSKCINRDRDGLPFSLMTICRLCRLGSCWEARMML